MTVTMFEMIVRKYVTRLVNKNRKTKKEGIIKAVKKNRNINGLNLVTAIHSSQKVQVS